MDTITPRQSYFLSHIVILKFFVLWGILETLIYMITGGNKYKEFIIHVVIFIMITMYAYYYPDISEHIK